MTDDSADLPPAAIHRKVQAGELGRKSGHGWFTYTDSPAAAS